MKYKSMYALGKLFALKTVVVLHTRIMVAASIVVFFFVLHDGPRTCDIALNEIL